MTDIISLFDLESIRTIAKNIVPTIAPITFIYLYLKDSQTYFLILSLISLFFLAFYINLNERMILLAGRKISSIKVSKEYQLGEKIGAFFLKDKVWIISLIISFLFSIIAFVLLCFNLVDRTTWILWFLCLFAAFYYLTGLISSVYIGRKYWDLLK